MSSTEKQKKIVPALITPTIALFFMLLSFFKIYIFTLVSIEQADYVSV